MLKKFQSFHQSFQEKKKKKEKKKVISPLCTDATTLQQNPTEKLGYSTHNHKQNDFIAHLLYYVVPTKWWTINFGTVIVGFRCHCKNRPTQRKTVISGLLFDRFSNTFIFVWSILLMVTVDWEVPFLGKVGTGEMGID